ncbi:UNVERIFIED_ORG: hypothetical protein FNL38_1017 [Nocardia globerula]|uniref:Uncharacterized protein n=1 Tax=Nocardia globerula TaxID=1818 RepID=A0A652YVB6_NOCGL|nr:hypothetical protein C8E04_1209 [Rhodococcus globerulus]
MFSPPVAYRGLRPRARSWRSDRFEEVRGVVVERVDRGVDFVGFEVRFNDRIQQRVNAFRS